VVAATLVTVGAATAVAHHAPPGAPAVAGEAMAVSANRTQASALAAAGVTRLVVYGHSMPAGGGASDPSRKYAVLTADALGLRLVDRAVGGTGAANATKTMQAARPAGPHDAVVLHTGMNDIFRRGVDAVAHGRQAVRHFLAGTADAGRRVVVLECQPISWQDTPPHRNLQPAYEAWNAMLREEAAAWRDVAVLDTCERWDARRFEDPGKYHPNDDGHARIARALAALLASTSPVREESGA
jgi:lysophospholipase L1-like esterase